MQFLEFFVAFAIFIIILSIRNSWWSRTPSIVSEEECKTENMASTDTDPKKEKSKKGSSRKISLWITRVLGILIIILLISLVIVKFGLNRDMSQLSNTVYTLVASPVKINKTTDWAFRYTDGEDKSSYSDGKEGLILTQKSKLEDNIVTIEFRGPRDQTTFQLNGTCQTPEADSNRILVCSGDWVLKIQNANKGDAPLSGTFHMEFRLSTHYKDGRYEALLYLDESKNPDSEKHQYSFVLVEQKK